MSKSLAEVLQPQSDGDKVFKAKHPVVLHKDRAGNGPDVFKAGNVKKSDRKKDRHGYEPGEDEKVYEDTEVETKSADVKMTKPFYNPRTGKIEVDRIRRKQDIIRAEETLHEGYDDQQVSYCDRAIDLAADISSHISTIRDALQARIEKGGAEGEIGVNGGFYAGDVKYWSRQLEDLKDSIEIVAERAELFLARTSGD